MGCFLGDLVLRRALLMKNALEATLSVHPYSMLAVVATLAASPEAPPEAPPAAPRQQHLAMFGQRCEEELHRSIQEFKLGNCPLEVERRRMREKASGRAQE